MAVTKTRLAVGALALTALLAGCNPDEGEVRNIGTENGGSPSGSGPSGSGPSGSASGTGSASATGTGASSASGSASATGLPLDDTSEIRTDDQAILASIDDYEG